MGVLAILSKGVEMVITYLEFQKTLTSFHIKGFYNLDHHEVRESVRYWTDISKISSKPTFDVGLPENELPILQGQSAWRSPKAGWVGRTQQISFNELLFVRKQASKNNLGI